MYRTGLLLACLLLACRSTASAPTADFAAAAPAAAAPAAPAPRPPHAPLSQEELATTDGTIAVGNLEASIEGIERLLRTQPKDLILQERLAALLATRGQYLGRIADHERAAEIGERLVRGASKEPRPLFVRAQGRATFHRFAEAQADLDQFEKLDKKDDRTAALRASILAALGRSEEALAIQQLLTKARPELLSLGAEAALRGELGQFEQAEALFVKAQRLHPDSSPFPLAWLYFQHGLLFEAAGRAGRARELFLAARDRLPAYAAATAHLAAALAATGDRAQAIAILRPLLKASDDPEYAGQLSGLLRDAGHTKEADELREQARVSYEALLKRHPEAYGAHAARFYLGAGGDAARALVLALRNLDKLPASPEAHTLAIDAAAAAGPPARACVLADSALKLPRQPARLSVAAARALAACGQGERAAALLKKE